MILRRITTIRLLYNSNLMVLRSSWSAEESITSTLFKRGSYTSWGGDSSLAEGFWRSIRFVSFNRIIKWIFVSWFGSMGSVYSTSNHFIWYKISHSHIEFDLFLLCHEHPVLFWTPCFWTPYLRMRVSFVSFSNNLEIPLLQKVHSFHFSFNGSFNFLFRVFFWN